MFDVGTNQSWPIGFMINPMPNSIPTEWIEKFYKIPAAIASDCIGRNIGAIGLEPYHGFGHMCGTAVTVRVRPGDNLMILKALQMVRPGDVLVVDGGGDTSRALIGGIMRTMAIQSGVTGIVVNGAIRDREEWAEGDLPVFAAGCVHRGPSTDSSGEINVPVSCSGLVVHPGDLVIGDADGVVAVPGIGLNDLYTRCMQLIDKEQDTLMKIAHGMLSKDRFDRVLPRIYGHFKKAYNGPKECLCRREESSAQNSNTVLLNKPVSQALIALKLLES